MYFIDHPVSKLANMKKQTLIIALFAGMLSLLSSCAVVGGIFKTGIGVGIFIVVIIAIIIFAASRMGKNKP